jgi:hypothetical protein
MDVSDAGSPSRDITPPKQSESPSSSPARLSPAASNVLSFIDRIMKEKPWESMSTSTTPEAVTSPTLQPQAVGSPSLTVKRVRSKYNDINLASPVVQFDLDYISPLVGIRSTSKMNINQKLCLYETSGGECRDDRCRSQHRRDYQQTDYELFKNTLVPLFRNILSHVDAPHLETTLMDEMEALRSHLKANLHSCADVSSVLKELNVYLQYRFY